MNLESYSKTFQVFGPNVVSCAITGLAFRIACDKEVAKQLLTRFSMQ